MSRTRQPVSKRELKLARRTDDRVAFAAIAFNYVFIIAAAGMAVWIHRIPVTLIAIVIIAGRQSALQGLVHSACHYSLFSRKQDNIRFQFLFAYPILDCVPLYREQHLEHHRDFSLKTPDRFDYLYDCLQMSRQGIWNRTWVVFIRPLSGNAGIIFLSDTVKTLTGNPRETLRLVGYWTLVLFTAWWLGGLSIVFVYWIAPLVWLYPVLDIWAELSDHLNAEGESRNQIGFFYSAMFKGHEMYHAVHHLYPFIPFHRLRGINDKLQQRGVVIESSRGPLDFLRIVYRGQAFTTGVISSSQAVPRR
ncbi:MAG TPA: fatty acid desaturase [Pyrinomonadaceae bacterium]|jgi:fatty acid desaturase|nr:fatty acid desaturase [Pyrinomonadaceae bacterium]